MVNINLASGGEKKEGVRWGFMIPLEVAIFVILGGLIGFLIFDQKMTEEKIAQAKAELSEKEKALRGGNAQNVFDFQNRLTESEKLLKNETVAGKVLSEMERVVVEGVYIASFDLDETKKTLALSCVAKNFSQVADQIAAFKKSDLFSEVSGGTSEISGAESIKFNISLKLK